MILSNGNTKKPSSYLQLGLALGIWSAIYWLLAYFAGRVPNPGETGSIFWGENYLAFLSAMILIATTLYLVDVYVRYSLSITSLFGLTLLCTVINHYANKVAIPTLISSFIVNLAILGIAFNLGKLIGLLVNERSYIVPLALVAAVADLWSVLAGPTAHIIEAPTYYRYFLICYPRLGSEILHPMVGLGDFTFLALFLTLIPRFNLRVRTTSWGFIVSFIIALLLSVISNKGIPVIPFMATAFLAANWGLLEFKSNDIWTAFIFIALLLVTAILFTYLSKPRIPNILPPQSPRKAQVEKKALNSVDTSRFKP
jgi:preprotein translocase subunit SecG